MIIGKFSEPRGKSRNSGVNVGLTSFSLNTEDDEPKNQTIPINSGIGKSHNPKRFYNRQSDIKSIGGYIESDVKEGEND
jgi:hypothetical protein